MTLKKYFSFTLLLSALVLLHPETSMAQAKDDSAGMLDDSIKDISIVLGSGVAGAILGLSTLSFVERPSDHLKNIAAGGAIGIVIGVGVVIFSQATRSTLAITAQMQAPMNPEKSESLARHEFSEYKIAKAQTEIPNVGYSFSF